MVIIGVVGRMGGAGKTTLAIHLAADVASRGRSVTVVDCDTQGSATHWAEPGHLPMPVVHHSLEHARDIDAWSRVIRTIDADIVVLDAPPHLDAALGGVIGLSDIVVVPCSPSGMDLIATAETVGLVREVRGKRGGDRPTILLVPNRVDMRTRSGRELSAALKDMKEPVAPAIGSRTAFSDAFNAGDWVGSYAPRSPAHREMQALAKRVEKLVKGIAHGDGEEGKERPQRKVGDGRRGDTGGGNRAKQGRRPRRGADRPT